MSEDLIKRLNKAEKSLKAAGFEDRGGELWAPPVRKDAFAPKYFKLEKMFEQLLDASEDIGPGLSDIRNSEHISDEFKEAISKWVDVVIDLLLEDGQRIIDGVKEK